MGGFFVFGTEKRRMSYMIFKQAGG